MIEIYVDGAYASSRDLGGWAFVVLDNGEKIHSAFYPVSNTTNNRMEIQAALEACLWAKEQNYDEITIYSDSMYVVGSMRVDMNWKRNKNLDLWEKLDEAVKGFHVIFRHIKGHQGNKWNELCDALAVQATL